MKLYMHCRTFFCSVSIEGFASPSSPLDRTITSIVDKKELKKEDINARSPKYLGPTHLKSAHRSPSPESRKVLYDDRIMIYLKKILPATQNKYSQMMNTLPDYKHRPASPRDIQVLILKSF